jgi:hypothetical protein
MGSCTVTAAPVQILWYSTWYYMVCLIHRPNMGAGVLLLVCLTVLFSLLFCGNFENLTCRYFRGKGKEVQEYR